MIAGLGLLSPESAFQYHQRNYISIFCSDEKNCFAIALEKPAIIYKMFYLFLSSYKIYFENI